MRRFVILHFLFLLFHTCPQTQLICSLSSKLSGRILLFLLPNPSRHFRELSQRKSRFVTNSCRLLLCPLSDPPLPALSLPPDACPGVARRGGGDGGYGSPSPRSSSGGGSSIRSLGLGGSISRRSAVRENSEELQEEDPRSPSPPSCSSPLEARGEAYAYSPDE